jgi:hypothetical protein
VFDESNRYKDIVGTVLVAVRKKTDRDEPCPYEEFRRKDEKNY